MSLHFVSVKVICRVELRFYTLEVWHYTLSFRVYLIYLIIVGERVDLKINFLMSIEASWTIIYIVN